MGIFQLEQAEVAQPWWEGFGRINHWHVYIVHLPNAIMKTGYGVEYENLGLAKILIVKMKMAREI